MALRIALFGQAAFAKDVLTGLLEAGHEIAGVYAPPEGKRPDPLAEEAGARGLPLMRHKRFRRKGEAIAELVEEHAALGAELNLLAYVTAILPVEILDAPAHGSLCFHPSLLPEYRGGAAIPWQIMLGAREAGVTVFRPDAGVDTGPMLVRKGGVEIAATDNAASLYYDKLYPLGVEAMLEATARIDRGDAAFEVQDESRASFQGLVDDEAARIDWSRPAAELDRWIRGCDPQPGAHAQLDGTPVRLFGARLEDGQDPGGEAGRVVGIEAGEARIRAEGGVLRVAKARVGAGAKLPAEEAGLREGQRLR